MPAIFFFFFFFQPRSACTVVRSHRVWKSSIIRNCSVIRNSAIIRSGVISCECLAPGIRRETNSHRQRQTPQTPKLISKAIFYDQRRKEKFDNRLGSFPTRRFMESLITNKNRSKATVLWEPRLDAWMLELSENHV